MKTSEIKKLLNLYQEIVQKQKKKHSNNFELTKKLKEIEHRYFHETGRSLRSDLDILR